jgi:calpain
VGCGIDGAIEGKRSDGLMTGHAYSILDAFEITDKDGAPQKLVRIQNPWGSGNSVEWNGVWSDGSLEIINNIDAVNKAISLVGGPQAELFVADNPDGQFLMAFDDFAANWGDMCVVVNLPSHWSAIRFNDRWDESLNTGWLNDDEWKNNLMYRVEVNKRNSKSKCKLWVEFVQPDGRLTSTPENGFPYKSTQAQHMMCWLKLDPGQKILDAPYQDNYMGDSEFIRSSREGILELELENGNYLVVPMPYKKDVYVNVQMTFYFDCDKSEINIIDAKERTKGEFINRNLLCNENLDKVDVSHGLGEYLKSLIVKEEGPKRAINRYSLEKGDYV